MIQSWSMIIKGRRRRVEDASGEEQDRTGVGLHWPRLRSEYGETRRHGRLVGRGGKGSTRGASAQRSDNNDVDHPVDWVDRGETDGERERTR